MRGGPGRGPCVSARAPGGRKRRPLGESRARRLPVPVATVARSSGLLGPFPVPAREQQAFLCAARVEKRALFPVILLGVSLSGAPSDAGSKITGK
mgnify:CR=1 FL=1